MKLDVKAFALTCAMVCGLGLFCLTWWIIALDGSSGEITFLGRLYLGYSITLGIRPSTPSGSTFPGLHASGRPIVLR